MAAATGPSSRGQPSERGAGEQDRAATVGDLACRRRRLGDCSLRPGNGGNSFDDYWSFPEFAKTVNTVDGTRGQTRTLQTCSLHRRLIAVSLLRTARAQFHQGPRSIRSQHRGRIYGCNLMNRHRLLPLQSGVGPYMEAARKTSCFSRPGKSPPNPDSS